MVCWYIQDKTSHKEYNVNKYTQFSNKIKYIGVCIIRQILEFGYP